ncbi:MAG: exonuclease domain-containing protein [Brachybacterium sp.]
METLQPASLGFTAIDFETANASRASACAVGLAKVRDGVVVDTASWLIAPPPGLEDFAPRNVAIHGISPEMVADAPTWGRVFPEVMSFVGSDDLVAHNAPFDRSVFQQVCSVFDLDGPDAGWYDTLPIARRLLTLGSYSLPFVARALDLEDLTHHEALADAVQAARIAVALSRRAGAGSLGALASPLGYTAAGARSPRFLAAGDGSRAEGDFSSLAATDVLAGQSVVFTGKLTLHTREEAHALVEYFGGVCQASVTKKTTILVSGDLDPRTFRPGATLSRKLQKAMDLAETGQRIEIWTEQDLHERIAVGREELEAATRAQRAASRSGWLPDYVVEQGRAQVESDLEYSAWLRAALRHPEGRPAPDALCVRCGGEFGETVFWMFLERRVCSGECNDALKRAAKRAWSAAGIARPAAPTYAASYGRG